MYLNEHKIDWVKSWTKKASTQAKYAESGRYIKNKADKTLDREHKIAFRVNHRKTAEELSELFTNTLFDIVVISGFYKEEYNGIYQLIKGNITLDDTAEFWEGTIWLENTSDDVRYSLFQDEFSDSDFYEIQSKTSSYASLTYKDVISGTWADRTVGIGVTTGTYSKLLLTPENVHNLVLEADITAPTSGTTSAGFIIGYRDPSHYACAVIHINDSSKNISVYEYYSGTTFQVIAQMHTGQILANGYTYNFKVVRSGNQYDFYIDNTHAVSAYMTLFPSGRMGLIDFNSGHEFSNIKVTREYPRTQYFPAGFSNAEQPQKNSNVYSDGHVLQRITHANSDVLYKSFASRILYGEVKVWDTMDNDFSQTHVPPKPLAWQRVYDKAHEFVGNIYIENGMYGILVADNVVYHYVYDRPYRKGSNVDINFKQTPDYEVWNESYSGREFLSKGQGVKNWDENGLNFEPVEQMSGIEDVVQNNVKIPMLNASTLGGVAHRVDITFTPKKHDVITSMYIGGLILDTDKKALSMLYDPDNEQITFEVENAGDLVNDTFVLTGFEVDKTHRLSVVVMSDEHGLLIYHNGALVHRESRSEKAVVDYAYEYDEHHDGYVDIGNSGNTSYQDNGFYGNIERFVHKTANHGITRPASVDQPLMWIRFDESDWDNMNSKFRNMGSGGSAYDVSNSSRIYSKFVKNGRYNQSMLMMQTAGASSYNASSLSVSTTGNMTVESWIKTPSSAPSGGETWVWRLSGASSERILWLIMTSTDIRVQVYNSGGALDGGSDYRPLTVAGTSIYDGKWHHIAVVRERDASSNTLKIEAFVDGVSTVSYTFNTSTEWAPSDTAVTTIYVGGTYYTTPTDFEIDEFMLTEHTKRPEEFGVIVEDIADQGQWYSKAEVEKLPDGKLRRKDDPKLAYVELGTSSSDSKYFVNRVFNMTRGTYAGTLDEDLYIDYGKAGMAIGKYQNQRFTFNVGFESNDIDNVHAQREKDWTVQMYFYLKQLASTKGGKLCFFEFTQEGVSTNGVSLYMNTSDQLEVYVDGGFTTVGSASITAKTVHHLAVTYKSTYLGANSGTLTVYVDSVEVGSVDVNSLFNVVDAGTTTNILGIFKYGSYFDGWISNFMFHQTVLHPQEFGIEVDTEHEIPTLYAKHTPYQRSITKTTLTKITPELVEFEFSIEDRQVQAWVESNDYFFKTNWEQIPDTYKLERVGIETTFDNSDLYHRFGLVSDTLYDAGLVTSDISFTSSQSIDNALMLFDQKRSNLMFISSVTNDNTSTYQWYGRLSENKIYGVISTSYKGYCIIGFVPNRVVPEMVWDASESSLTKKSYSASGWFVSEKYSTTSGVEINGTGYEVNHRRFDAGKYLFIVRSSISSASYTYNIIVQATSGTIISKSLSNTTLDFQKIHALIDSALAEEEIYCAVKTATTAADTFCDYIVVIPLTNGNDFPLDYLEQSLGKREMKKMLH